MELIPHFLIKGGSGSGGSSKAVKEWDDFYNKMLAKITDYGKGTGLI